MENKPTYEELEQIVRELKNSDKEIKKIKDEGHRHKEDYQTLFREMLDGFALHEIICNANGKPVDYRFLNVNPSFERMTGLTSEMVKGKTVLEALPGIEAHWIDTYGKVALTGEPVFFDNYSEVLDKHFQVTAFRPKLNQFACIFSDVTNLKQSEAELARLNAILKNKNEELEQVVYVASHDLRSPLVNIDGYSKELEYGIEDLRSSLISKSSDISLADVTTILNEDIPEALKFIRTSTAKMDTLLAGLLRLSRSGRSALKIQSLDMNEMISKVIDSTEFQIKETNVEVSVEDLPPCHCDAIQVDQIFTNLLTNALKCLEPNRPGIIKITGNVVDDQSVYCVEDNGIGIDVNHIDKIFEIFHQLDPAKNKGEGLGLTIVKRVLGRLDGSVHVESELGIGSRFYVSLPKSKL